MKKYDNNNNVNEKNEIIENDKIFDKKPNKLIEILGNEIIIKRKWN